MNELVRTFDQTPVVALTDDAKQYAKQAMAEGTRRSYKAKWRSWESYCAKNGLLALPADPNAVANWLAHLAKDGKAGGRRAQRAATGHAVGSLRIAVAAIKQHHRAKGLGFDTSHPSIALVLQGVSRVKAEVPAQAAPLRRDLILEVLAGLGATPIEQRDAALISLGYMFGRRRSELAGLDLDVMGAEDDQLTSGVLLREPTILKLVLVRHKTGDGTPKPFVVPRGPNAIAVMAIERWIDTAKIQPGTPVFRRVLKGGEIGTERLRAGSVAEIIQRRIAAHLIKNGTPKEMAEREAQNYAGHSLRVGLAVTSAENGVDLREIQMALGHATPAMASRYAASAEAERTSPHQKKGVGLG
jgi:site-specific recombinase XerD